MSNAPRMLMHSLWWRYIFMVTAFVHVQSKMHFFCSCIHNNHRRAHKSTWTHAVKSSRRYTLPQSAYKHRRGRTPLLETRIIKKKTSSCFLWLRIVPRMHIHYKCTFRVASTSTSNRHTIWSHIIFASIFSHRHDGIEDVCNRMRASYTRCSTHVRMLSIDFFLFLYSRPLRLQFFVSFSLFFRSRIYVYYLWARSAKFMGIRIMCRVGLFHSHAYGMSIRSDTHISTNAITQKMRCVVCASSTCKYANACYKVIYSNIKLKFHVTYRGARVWLILAQSNFVIVRSHFVSIKCRFIIICN